MERSGWLNAVLFSYCFVRETCVSFPLETHRKRSIPIGFESFLFSQQPQV